MDRVNILDCTLRDGGYINQFNFGHKTIQDIISKLSKASIDIIECGFLVSGKFDVNKSLFGSVSFIKKFIKKKNPKLMYVAMLQFGKISEDEIEEYDGTSIDGIRLTFHENEIEEAFILGAKLKEKGYKIFMQPVGTVTYTDEAFLTLIKRVNALEPYAFYIVDTLGTMYKNDLLRMYYLVDHNLRRNIVVGFHSHNNLQLSFANAQELMQLNTERKLIIDTSVYGMGRGAGNLCTELVTQYVNMNLGYKYDNLEILSIIDENIKPLSIQYSWGYDAAYYIASITGCHPNYATFLINKQTLTVRDIFTILNSIDEHQRGVYNEKCIDEKYNEYMKNCINDYEALNNIKSKISDRPVILLASGKNLFKNKDKIINTIKEKSYYAISVNFIPDDIPIDMLFISNMKRYNQLKNQLSQPENSLLKNDICVTITSNIVNEENINAFVVDYSKYLNEEKYITDNAGLMCINMLRGIEVREIQLAGFDGYSENLKDNFYKTAMMIEIDSERMHIINKEIKNKLKQISSQLKIGYLTESTYGE